MRRKTNQISVGEVLMGGNAPIVVQSMLNAAPDDAQANLAQIELLRDAGCEVVRMAVPNKACLESFKEVCAHSPLPVVADIHFSAELGIAAIEAGASKLRINPGNIGGLNRTRAILEAASAANIPVRIGVNAGSLDRGLAQRDDLSLPEKLFLSAKEYLEFCYECGFHDCVISAKAHDVSTTVETYRLIAQNLDGVPLHIGITEAGTTFQGIIKSSAGLGMLLNEGIGDTLRISLTDDPLVEVRAAWTLLNVLGVRKRGVEIISCPTCGRTQVNLIDLAHRVEARLQSIERPLKVAVMGCVVNGPGEAADADIGVACGLGTGLVFVKGKVVRKVSEDAIIEALMEEIGKL